MIKRLIIGDFHGSSGRHSKKSEGFYWNCFRRTQRRNEREHPRFEGKTGTDPCDRKGNGLHPEYIRSVAGRLAECGVNDLLLSVDAFHQETIPLGAVKGFARAAKEQGIPIRLQPAWLVSQEHKNPYNEKTRAILESFADLDIPVGDGNVIFPEGNALKYLAEYFADGAPENPYEEDPRDVRCISFSPDGGVLDGNAKEKDILEIIESYRA